MASCKKVKILHPVDAAYIAGFVDDNKGTVLDIDLAVFNKYHRDTIFHGDGFERKKHAPVESAEQFLNQFLFGSSELC